MLLMEALPDRRALTLQVIVIIEDLENKILCFHYEGVVRGSYSLVSGDGIKRIVTYIADENGFRAQVNENRFLICDYRALNIRCKPMNRELRASLPPM